MRPIFKVIQRVVVVEVESGLGKNELDPTSGRKGKLLQYLRPMRNTSFSLLWWLLGRSSDNMLSVVMSFPDGIGTAGSKHSTATETFLEGLESTEFLKEVFIILQLC